MKTIEVELSDVEICHIVREYFSKEKGIEVGTLEINETDDQCTFIRFRVREE